MNVRIYLINDAIVSIVDTRLRLPTEILLKGMQQECSFNSITIVGPNSPPDVGGPRHFC